LQPLSYPDPARIVRFLTEEPDGKAPSVNVPEFSLWKAQKDVFEEVAAYDDLGPALYLTSGRFPEQIQGQHVTAGFFRLFGAKVVLGRTFTEAEDGPNGGNWVVLSEGLWRRHFSADPHVVGTRGRDSPDVLRAYIEAGCRGGAREKCLVAVVMAQASICTRRWPLGGSAGVGTSRSSNSRLSVTQMAFILISHE